MKKWKLFHFLFLMMTICLTTVVLEEYVHAESSSDITYIADKYISVQNGQFTIDDEQTLKQELELNKWQILELDDSMTPERIMSDLKIRLQALNEQAQVHALKIRNTKEIVYYQSGFRSMGHAINHYWWGAKHTFYSDNAARNFARSIKGLAYANSGVAMIAAAVFPGIGGIPNGLSAIYGNMLADSVDYNANQPGNGVILDVNWWLTFKCYPR